jgi:hypothetical protein
MVREIRRMEVLHRQPLIPHSEVTPSFLSLSSLSCPLDLPRTHLPICLRSQIF